MQPTVQLPIARASVFPNPRPRKFRKVNRKAYRKTYEVPGRGLVLGRFGLQAIEPGLLGGSQLEAVRRYITGALKRRGKVWIRARPDYPRTAKPREVRMGRGKGAVKDWVAVIKPGRVLVEAVYARDPQLLRETLAFVVRKLPMKARVIERGVLL
jgi:large subunit ribosomal protein L16